MILKRYQYWSKDGITWTNWFTWNSTIKDPIQFKGRINLLNEYRKI